MSPESIPETRYAVNRGVHIAYQALGEGPPDLGFVAGLISHCEHQWEEPALARSLRRMARFSRLIWLDKRGTGLSDPVPLSDTPILEQQMEDLAAVLDSVGSERTALFAASDAGPMCILFAATYHERVSALVLYGTSARLLAAPDYPAGMPPGGIRADRRNGKGGLGNRCRAAAPRPLRGLAVHIGARVAALAQPGEVLVSQTVKDLVTGSGLALTDRGVHELKGVPEAWRVFWWRLDFTHAPQVEPVAVCPAGVTR
jgi:pimeloyl-ACP methyl ester carboxylesterase